MTVGELIAFTDDALAGLPHRRIDFEQISAGDEARAGFEALGWRTLRLLYLRHESPPPPGPEIVVEQVPYDAVYGLRASWSHEDLPGQDPTAFIAEAREVAMRRDVQVLAVHEGGAPIAYTQIEREGIRGRDHPGLRPPRSPGRWTRHRPDTGGDRGGG